MITLSPELGKLSTGYRGLNCGDLQFSILDSECSGRSATAIYQDRQEVLGRFIWKRKIQRLVQSLTNSAYADSQSSRLLKAQVVRDLQLKVTLSSDVFCKCTTFMIHDIC